MTANELTQAEIASGIFKTGDTCPVKGQLLCDFELKSTDGRKISASDYRGHANLVLMFVDGRRRSLRLLAEVAKGYGKIHEEQAEVVAVLQGTTEKAAQVKDEARADFPVLVDRGGRIHRLMGAQDRRGLCLRWQCSSQIALAKSLPYSGKQKSRACPECKRFSDGWSL